MLCREAENNINSLMRTYNMIKRWRRIKKELNDKPAIDANEVNEIETDPLGNAVYGRYAGQLLSPDEPFCIESQILTDSPDGPVNKRT